MASSKQSSLAKGVGFSEGVGGLPLRCGLRWASNLILDEMDSIDKDLVSLVNSDSVSSVFFDRIDNGSLLILTMK